MKPRIPLETYEKRFKNRDAALLTAYADRAYTQVELARHFGLHDTTVSRLIARAGESKPPGVDA